MRIASEDLATSINLSRISELLSVTKNTGLFRSLVAELGKSDQCALTNWFRSLVV